MSDKDFYSDTVPWTPPKSVYPTWDNMMYFDDDDNDDDEDVVVDVEGQNEGQSVLWESERILKVLC